MNKKSLFKKSCFIIIPLLVFLFSLTLGRYHISIRDILKVFGARFLGLTTSYPETLNTVLFNVRVPRTIVAMIVGASLSVAGASYQGMFRNPMVSPDILGASAGAGFGAALGILLSLNVLGIQLLSFGFGLLAVAITYFISNKTMKSQSTLVLILAGMLIGTLFSSFTSLIKYVADPFSKLPAITFWLMGSLNTVTKKDIPIVLIPFLISVIPLFMIRWKLNVMSFGEEEANALGVDTKKIKILVILCSTLITASSVAICGLVGWVGLVVPHICRMIVGPNFKNILPATLSIGATYLLLVDDVARSLIAFEIPLGILTSIVGAPFFIYLLLKARKGWI